MPKRGLLLAFLPLFVSACGGTEIVYRDRPVPVEVVRYRSTPVDRSLFRECEPVPLDEVETNGEMLEAAIEANKRLEQCGAEKAKIAELLQ